MGGFNSGRRFHAETPTVCHTGALPAQAFKDTLADRDDSEIHAGRVRLPDWGRGVAPTDWREVLFGWRVEPSERSGRYAKVTLAWFVDDDPPTVRQAVHVDRDERTVTAPNHDGDATGYQYYWFCPACGERREKLHNPALRDDDRWACRECWSLGYWSSRHSRNPRVLFKYRANNLRERAGGERLSDRFRALHTFPERPPNMDPDKYEELKREHRDLADRAEAYELQSIRVVSSAATSRAADGLTDLGEQTLGRVDDVEVLLGEVIDFSEE